MARARLGLPHEVMDSRLWRTMQVEVFFILAKGYLSHELGMLGFPAYDRSQLLLGFYKEVSTQQGQTQVRDPRTATCGSSSSRRIR